MRLLVLAMLTCSLFLTQVNCAYAELTQDQKVYFYSIVMTEMQQAQGDVAKLMTLCEKTTSEKRAYIRAFKQKQVDEISTAVIRLNQQKAALENDLSIGVGR